MSGLVSVGDALSQILEDVVPTGAELLPLAQCGGRILAEDLTAKRTQPPFPASAMDGYAVRAADVAKVPVTLERIGESAAGHGFSGAVDPGQCVRIFTGAPLPDGTDTVVIQENVAAEGTRVTVLQAEKPGRYVRPAGFDFSKGECLLKKGVQLGSAALSLAASMNHPRLPVHRRPIVAIISSGDELKLPGEDPGPDDIIASNNIGVARIIEEAGAVPLDLGIARDTLASLAGKLQQAAGADVIVTLGGASVGEHDLVQKALAEFGVTLGFWKMAMRPGKPVMFGRKEADGKPVRVLGLPGNPVSSLVGARILLDPLIKALLGLKTDQPMVQARLAVDLPENDQRAEYMRAIYEVRDDDYFVTPFDNQDSSVLTLLARANCLMLRPAHAPAAAAGTPCEIILL